MLASFFFDFFSALAMSVSALLTGALQFMYGYLSGLTGLKDFFDENDYVFG